jgi:hypothetical protein
MSAVAVTPGDSTVSTLEIVVSVMAAFVLGFAVGRVAGLRRKAG